MRKSLILGILAITACSPQRASDGYTFDRQDFERDNIAVKIVQFDTRADFDRAARAVGLTDATNLMAFSTLSRDKPACTIRVMRIPTHYEPKWIGHELVHCIYGQFHTAPPL